MLKLIFSLVAVLGFSTAAAQVDEQPLRSAERPLGVTVEVGGEYFMDASVDSAPEQDLAITRTRLGLEYKQPAQASFLQAGLMYEYSGYDFSGAANDLDVSGVGADVLYSRTLEDGWGYFVMGGVQAMAEDDGSLSDGVTITIAGGVSYTFSPDFELMAGLGYGSRLEDSDSFYPAVGIEWQITEQLKLRTANGAFLTYDWHGDRETVLDASLAYESRQFALSSTPAAGDRAVEDSAWLLTAGVTQRFGEGWYVRPALHVALERELETRTERAGTSDLDQDTAVGVSLEAGWRF